MRERQENQALQNQIMSALSMIDEKGTNEKVTMAMSIVYEAFKCHSSKRDIAASKLYKAAELAIIAEKQEQA